MSNKAISWFLLYLLLMGISVFLLIQTWEDKNWVTGSFDSIAIGWIVGLNVILGIVIILKQKSKKKERNE